MRESTGGLLDREESDDAETFSEGHADDADGEDVAEGSRITTDSLSGFGSNQADAESSAKAGETGDEAFAHANFLSSMISSGGGMSGSILSH